MVRERARSGAPEGACCIADEQTAGRGRQGRHWQATPGSALLMSILLRPSLGALPGVPLAAGLAVGDAVATLTGVMPGLKWPNDVLIGGRKLAGTLAEAETQGPDQSFVVLGIGCNITAAAVPPDVGISLEALVGTQTPPSRDAVLAALLPALGRWLTVLDDGGIAALRAPWEHRAVGLGGEVVAETANGTHRGIARRLTDNGGLLLETGDGPVELTAGDVHLVSPGI